MSELPVEEIIVLRKRLKKLIKKAEAFPEVVMFEMETYTSCAFSQITREDITTDRLAKFLRIKSVSYLSQNSYAEGLTPLEASVVALFTTKIGHSVSSTFWIKKAKKVSKKLKKYIIENTEQPLGTVTAALP